MNYIELLNLLGVENNAIPSNQVTISIAAFNSNIRYLMHHVYTNGDIIIDTANLLDSDETKQSIKISGNATFLHVEKVPSMSEFWIDKDGNLQCCIAYQLPNQVAGTQRWRFSDSFKDLPALSKIDGSLFEDIQTKELFQEAHIPLDDFHFFESYFIICTPEQYEFQNWNENKVNVSQGLNFISKLNSSEIFPWLNVLFEINDPLSVVGKIDFPQDSKPKFIADNDKVGNVQLYPWDLLRLPDGKLPGIILEILLPVDKSIAGMFSFKGTAIYIYTPLSNEWVEWNMNPPLIPIMGYEGIANFGKHDLEMVLEIPYGGKSLKLAAFSSNTTLDGMAQLDAFLGTGKGNDLIQLFPERLTELLSGVLTIEILNLTLAIDYQNGISIPEVSLAFGFPKLSATLFENRFELKQISSKIKIINIQQDKKIYIDVYGSMIFEDILFSIRASNLNGFTFFASTKDKINLSLDKLANSLSIEPTNYPFNLDIDSFTFQIAPSKYYSVGLSLAEEPEPWSFDLGIATLTVSNVFTNWVYSTGSSFAGYVSGTINLAGVTTTINYNTPGNLTIRGELPEISLATMIINLVGEKPDFWPNDFDIIFSKSFIQMQKQQDIYNLGLGTSIKSKENKPIANLAFVVQKESNNWGFAAGAQVNVDNLSELLGDALGDDFNTTIGNLSDWIFVNEFTFIITSLKNPTFPVFSSFDQLQLTDATSGKITMPSIPNRGTGLYLFARNKFTKDSGGLKEALTKLLQIPNDTVLDIFLAIQKNHGASTIQFGMGITTYVTAPSSESSPSTKPFENGELIGVLMVETSTRGFPSLAMEASFKTIIQESNVEFITSIEAFKNAILVSGSMKTTKPLPFGPFKLGNVGLALGITFVPGSPVPLPSFGFTAEIEVDGLFHSSIAVMADSQNPLQSMVAGSLSDINIGKILDTLLGDIKTIDFPVAKEVEDIIKPGEVLDFLRTIEITGTKEGAFTVSDQDATQLIDALNKYEGQIIADHFNKHLGINSFPSASPGLMIFSDANNGKWYITEQAGNSLITHWQLALQQGGSLAVSKEAQFYFVPVDTNIGVFDYKQGFMISGRIAFHDFELEVDILLETEKGVKVVAQMDKIVLGTEKLFSIGAEEGNGGPKVNICTYDQPKQEIKEFQSPHFFINGEVTLLGDKWGIYAFIASSGINFKIDVSKFALLEGILSGSFSSTLLDVKGDISIGISKLDLGPLGTYNLNTGVQIVIAIWANAKDCGASIAGGIKVLGNGVFIDLKLNIETQTLEHIADLVIEELKAKLNVVFEEVVTFVLAVKDGLITGVENVANVLKSVYKLGYNEAAEVLKGAEYLVGEVGGFIKDAYNLGDEAMAEALKGAGYAIGEVGNFLKDAYKLGDEAMAEVLKGAGYAIGEVGGFLKDAYKLGDKAMAEALKGAGYAIGEVGNFLKDAYKLGDEAMAEALKGAGYAVGEVGNFLKSAYNLGDKAVAEALKGAGYAIGEVGNFLKSAYNIGDKAMAEALKGAGYAVGEVGNFLKSAYNLGDKAVAAALKGAGYAVNEIGKFFKSIFDIFGGLFSSNGIDEGGNENSKMQSAIQTAKVLKETEFAVAEVGTFINEAYSFNENEVTIVLLASEYNMDEVGSFLKANYNFEDDSIVTVLRVAGLGIDAIGELLKDDHNLTNKEMVIALKKGGYTIDEITNFLKISSNLNEKETTIVLREAGYSIKEIRQTIKNIQQSIKGVEKQ